MDLAVDPDGGFLFEAEAGLEFIHFSNGAAQVFGIDPEFAHPTGVAPA